MALRAVRRIPTTQAQERLGRIVEEVAATGEPVIIQKRGDDQAAIVSLRDLKRLQPAEEAPPTTERERVRAALRAAGLLSEPTAKMLEEAAEYNARR
jgi:prevent-host-death family protein